MSWKLTQVKGSDEEDVNPVNGRNLLHGVESVLCLDLDHGQQRVVGLLEVLGEAWHGIKALESNWGAKATSTLGRELGALDELAGFFCGSKQRY